jgi:hypothetical protein
MSAVDNAFMLINERGRFWVSRTAAPAKIAQIDRNPKLLERKYQRRRARGWN